MDPFLPSRVSAYRKVGSDANYKDCAHWSSFEVKKNSNFKEGLLNKCTNETGMLTHASTFLNQRSENGCKRCVKEGRGG